MLQGPARRRGRPKWDQGPRQEVAYYCAAGHDFTLVFAGGIMPPASWVCRCGAVAVSASAGAVPGTDGKSYAARCYRYLHERRTVEQLEELLAERLALLPAAQSRRDG